MEKKRLTFKKRFEGNDEQYIIRRNVINQLRKTFDDEEQLTEIESYILNLTLNQYKKPADFLNNDFINLYTHNAIYVLQNIDKDSAYYSGIKKFNNIQPEVLNPSKWKEHKIHYENVIKEGMENRLVTSNLFTCPVCKKNKTYYEAKQTRSADEGNTTFIICANCGHKWTKSA